MFLFVDFNQINFINFRITLDQDIPEHDNLSSFGPDFTLDVNPSMRPDRNSAEDVNKEVKRLLKQIEDYCKFQKS